MTDRKVATIHDVSFNQVHGVYQSWEERLTAARETKATLDNPWLAIESTKDIVLKAGEKVRDFKGEEYTVVKDGYPTARLRQVDTGGLWNIYKSRLSFVQHRSALEQAIYNVQESYTRSQEDAIETAKEAVASSGLPHVVLYNDTNGAYAVAILDVYVMPGHYGLDPDICWEDCFPDTLVFPRG